MRFAAQPEVFARFPSIRIAAAAARGLDNRTPRPEVEAGWRAAWTAAVGASQYGNAQSHPRVKPWRERFTAMGISGKEFPSSVEALLRRALKGGEPFTINPLVDWYNTISLRHLVPAGAFDLADIHGPLELRLTQPGDTFTSLDAEAPVAVPPGEVAYADGHTILTRQFVWRQARSGLVTPQTRNLVLVSEVLGEVGAEVADAVVADFQRGLREYFGLVSQGWIVDAGHPMVEW
jgi:DNA/RNA-binding domain of Phe-tRNA-synthetase-like protein